MFRQFNLLALYSTVGEANEDALDSRVILFTLRVNFRATMESMYLPPDLAGSVNVFLAPCSI